MNSIDRREAIKRVTVILGGLTLVGGSSLLSGCRRDDADSAEPFSPDDVAFLDEIADTILPETSTPGAKAAKTGAFMALMVVDTYEPRDREIFRTGLRTLDSEMRKESGSSFLQATPQQRLALLERIDREQKAHMDARREARRRRDRDRSAAAGVTPAGAPRPVDPVARDTATTPAGAAAVTADSPTHYFRMMKELALLGYFTSEIGCTQAQRYVEAPGRFDPCIPLKPGDKTWAGHA